MLLMSDGKELKNNKVINITLDGSSMYERNSVLNYLLRHKKISNIIYTLDGVSKDTYYKKDFSLLYKDNLNIKEKFSFYFQGHLDYKCFFMLLKNENCIGKKHDYYELQLEFSRPDYKLNEKDFIMQKNEFLLSDENEFLDKYLISYVKSYPDTTFHIIILPYHTLYYKKELDKLITIYKLAIRKLSNYKNVKIYFFGNEAFSDNINNYQNDKYHYKKHINSRINKAINEGTNIITLDNMDEEFNKFIKKVENYDIKAYKEALRLDIKE